MTISGTTALVFGATGNVGFGVALGLLDAGARVIAPTRTEAGAQQLREELAGRDIHPIIGDISDPTAAEGLRGRILAAGPLDHIVVSLGGWWQRGMVAGQPPVEWTRVRQMLLDGHVHAAGLMLPALSGRPGSTYTMITGAGALHYAPKTSLLYIATNGVLALSRVLREEHREGATRVNEVLIEARIEKQPRPGVVPSAVFGTTVCSLIEGTERGVVLRYAGPDHVVA